MTVPCVAEPCDAMQPDLRTEHMQHKREHNFTHLRLDD